MENFRIKLIVADASVAGRTFGGGFKVTEPESLLQSPADMLDLHLISVD